MDKKVYLDEKFTELLNMYPELDSIIIHAKEFYMNDNRNLEQIKKEIDIMIEKYKLMEILVNKDIPENILNESIVLIGPMGTGKSTISKELSKINNLDYISLDNEDELERYYKDRNKFSDFKEFEFYLVTSVLTNLDRPKVIDFGAGHSIYENPLMFLEFKKIINKFSNVVLVMPSEDKEESLQVVNERINRRNENAPQYVFDDNKHFVYSPCNYEVATITEYTNGKNIDQIISDIMEEIENKRRISYE